MKPITRIHSHLTKSVSLNQTPFGLSRNTLKFRTSIQNDSVFSLFHNQQIRWKRIVRVNPLQAILDRKAPKPVTDDSIRQAGKGRLVDDEGNNFGILSADDIIAMSRRDRKRIFKVSDNPPVYKIMFFKEKEKSDKIRLKEVRIRDVITEHDLQIKVDRIKRFLADQYKVQVILIFKKTHEADADVAHLLMTNIITRLKPFSEIDFSEKLSKDKKSVCVLNPLSPEKYAELGLLKVREEPKLREKKREKTEEEMSEYLKKKEEKMKKLKELRERNNQTHMFIPAEQKHKEMLEKYGETVGSIERKKALLDSGMTYAEVEKQLKREEKEYKKELKRVEEMRKNNEEEEEDDLEFFEKYSSRHREDDDDDDEFVDDYDDDYGLDEPYVPEFDDEYVGPGDEPMYRK